MNFIDAFLDHGDIITVVNEPDGYAAYGGITDERPHGKKEIRSEKIATTGKS